MSELENELLARYPFIQCRRVDDTPVEGSTYLGGMPKGWRLAFGRQMCEDIAKAAAADGVHLDHLRVIDVKEKFGRLRWYWGRTGRSRKIEDVTRRYEAVSSAFCAKCGSHPVMLSSGYVIPLCGECWKAWQERSETDAGKPFVPEFPVLEEDGNKVDLKPLFDSIVERQGKIRCR